MIFITFFKAVLVGLAVAIPVGPAGLLCLERTSSQGWRTGLSSVLGMNIADVCSALLVLVGVGFLSDFLKAHESTLSFLVGLVLIVVGIYFFYARERSSAASNSRELAYHGLSSFFLAISPSTLLLMLMLFSMLGIDGFNHSAPVILLGVATGSVIWGAGVLLAGKKLQVIFGTRSRVLKTFLSVAFVGLGLYAAVFAFI